MDWDKWTAKVARSKSKYSSKASKALAETISELLAFLESTMGEEAALDLVSSTLRELKRKGRLAGVPSDIFSPFPNFYFKELRE